MKLPEGIGFTARDFQRCIDAHADIDSLDWDAVAEDATDKLPALFEEWCKREGVKVFQRSSLPHTGHEFETGVWSTRGPLLRDTHQAYLMLVQKL